jgi:dTMP kinase
LSQKGKAFLLYRGFLIFFSPYGSAALTTGKHARHGDDGLVPVERGFHAGHQGLMSGLFVVFEGIDGSGKSTATAEIARRLTVQGARNVVLREPTEKTDASREIRRILRTVKDIDARISRELLDLFLIDRLWDLENQIKPALASGAVVLLDRYYLSTAAYQAAAVSETLEIMAGYLADSRILIPDLVVHLDLPVKTALGRLQQRRTLDVFESEAKLSGIAERYREAIAVFRRNCSAATVITETASLTDGDFDRLARGMLDGVQVKNG